MKRCLFLVAALFAAVLLSSVLISCPATEIQQDNTTPAQREADAFIATYADVLNLTESTVTMNDKNMINAALSDYSKLSDGAKELLTKEKEKLDLLSYALSFTTVLSVNFENGLINDANKFYFMEDAAKVFIGIDTAEKHSGERSCKITVTSTVENGCNAGLEYKFNPVPGKSYQLSFWVKSRDAVRGLGGQLAKVVCYTPNPKPENQWNEDFIAGTDDNGIAENTEWQKYSCAFEATSTAEIRMRFTFFCKSGTVWFDDIALVTEN
jgi:hypothetical protein